MLTRLPLAALAAALLVAAPAQAAKVSTDGLDLKPRKSSGARAAAGEPRLADQWAFQGDGPMGAESAWAQTTGGDVTVAVIDSGVDLDHPDLAGNLWTNPGEVPGNGVDDDRNGGVDDIHGYDFVNRDGNPEDQNGHGTHVAGTIGARGDNGVAGSGVAWRARIMAIRVLDANANGDTTNVAKGVRYATVMGAKIINLSLAGPGHSQPLAQAIAEARAAGVLVVAAAGNDGRDLAQVPAYPVSYTDDNVIGVAATAPGNGLFSLSNFGRGADIAAPGEDVLSTAMGGGTEWRSGTSMAAPHVAGTLVLLAAARPDLDWVGLRDALLGGVRASSLPVDTGRLDAGGALRRIIDPAVWNSVARPRAVTVKAKPKKKKKTKKGSSKRKPKASGSRKSSRSRKSSGSRKTSRRR